MSDQKNNFQDDLRALEEIVERFESGEIDLDQAINEFERGMKLADKLKQRLETMENKVTEIKRKFGQAGTSDEEPDS